MPKAIDRSGSDCILRMLMFAFCGIVPVFAQAVFTSATGGGKGQGDGGSAKSARLGNVDAAGGARVNGAPGEVRALSGATSGNYARLPLSVEKRDGGTVERFLSRTQNYTIEVENGKATVQALTPKGAQAKSPVSIEFAGAASSHALPGAELPGKVNYIRGNNPRKWRFGVPTYGSIVYPEVYPGIDVKYYGTQEQIEFDMVVKPGGDPGKLMQGKLVQFQNVSTSARGKINKHKKRVAAWAALG